MSDEIEVSSGGAHTLGTSGNRWASVWATSGVSPAPSITFSNDSYSGIYSSGGDKFKLSFGRLVSTQDVYALYHAGKNMKEHTQEYVDAILWLPWVNGNQLKMVETFEYFRKQLFPEADEV